MRRKLRWDVKIDEVTKSTNRSQINSSSHHGDVTASSHSHQESAGTRRRSSRDCSRARPTSPLCRSQPLPLPTATFRHHHTSPPKTWRPCRRGVLLREVPCPASSLRQDTRSGHKITSSKSMIRPSRRTSCGSLRPRTVSRLSGDDGSADSWLHQPCHPKRS